MPALSRLKLSREPAIYVQLVAKLIDALVLFGLDISDAQSVAVIAFVEVVAAFVTRGQVTPASANDPSNRAVAAAATSGDPVSDQRSEHEKLVALDVPPRPSELDGGTLKGFPSAKTPAKKAAATKR